MGSFLQTLQNIIQGNSWLAPFAAFLGGMLTASNPCVIAMIPLAMGLVGGTKERVGWLNAFIISLFFVLGLATTFMAMGIVAVAFGRMFGDVGGYWKYIVAVICFLVALHLFDVRFLQFKAKKKLANPKTKGILGAYLLGLLFGVVSAPCAAPILVLLLTIMASKANYLYGSILLLAYSIGHCVLIVIAGTSIGIASTLISSDKFQKFNCYFRRVAGVLIIGVGIYMVL